MHFVFSAPFRTGLNLNSLVSINSKIEVVAHITSSVNEVQKSLPDGLSWETPWKSDSKGELHYSELSEDLIPLSATPLLRFHISIDRMNAMVNEFENIEGIQIDSINECFIDYYDNTVAILCLVVELSFPNEKIKGFQLLDKWSTNLCAAIIIQLEKFEKILIDSITNKKINKKEIFLKIENFRVFFDQRIRHKNGMDEVNRMLWVTRIYLKGKEETNIDLLESWTQQIDLESKSQQVGQDRVAFCIGNSVVLNELTSKEYDAIFSSLSICTYFYVLNDIINRNLKTMFINLSNGSGPSISDISRVNKIRGHIEFIENEFSDVLLGLQGLRSQVANHLLETWHYPDLVKSVQRKKQAVGKMVDFSLQEKQGKYARVVEAILAAIGGVAVLDFALNLFSFANNSEISRDSIPGLVDIAKYLPPDGLLYVTIAIILIILFLVLKKR